jgi:hypothetical protein
MVGAPASSSSISPGEHAPAFDTIRCMTRLLSLRLLSLALLVSLVFAPTAAAYNDGRGFYGATNDKVVTDAGFILIVFFPTFVFAMSMIQRHLDKRKEARKAAHKTLMGSAAQSRGGW